MNGGYLNAAKEFIRKHGNFTHVMIVQVHNAFPFEDFKTEEEVASANRTMDILRAIRGAIDGKPIVQDICYTEREDEIYGGTATRLMQFGLQWQLGDETDLMYYFTDARGVVGDRAVQLHTEKMCNEVLDAALVAAGFDSGLKENATICLLKPLTQPVCMT